MRAMKKEDICCIKGCQEKVLALGLCNKHWRRNKKYGSPVATQNPTLTRGMSNEVRFNHYVVRKDGCWGWKGSKDQDGYAKIYITRNGERVTTVASRLSWELVHGKIPEGLLICHKCDNPTCTNPKHLFLGSTLDNMRDKIQKGRLRVAHGADSGHAKLTEAQVIEILLDPRPYSEVAYDYNVTTFTVRDIKKRRSWTYLENVEVSRRGKGGNKGEKRWNAKLTEDAVREIRSSSERNYILAQQYGVTQSTIGDIKKRRSWNHVI
jgi:hypothetical protein